MILLLIALISLSALALALIAGLYDDVQYALDRIDELGEDLAALDSDVDDMRDDLDAVVEEVRRGPFNVDDDEWDAAA